MSSSSTEAQRREERERLPCVLAAATFLILAQGVMIARSKRPLNL
jgi:hypothetical protein